jgi:hypothetical protein
MAKKYEKKPEGYVSLKEKKHIVVTYDEEDEAELEWGSFVERDSNESTGGYMSDREHGPGSGLY